MTVPHNRSHPPATVIPVLAYSDVRAAVTWLTDVFGFRERVRIGENHRAQMSIGSDGAMIVADTADRDLPPMTGGWSHMLKVRVDDVDAFFEHAKARGAHVINPPTDREYGERDCGFTDLGGHRWQFTQTIRDVAPEEIGCETVEAWPERRGDAPR